MKKTFENNTDKTHEFHSEIKLRDDGCYPFITFKHLRNRTFVIICKELVKSINAEDVLEFSCELVRDSLEFYVSDYFHCGLTMKCFIDEFDEYYISDEGRVFQFFCDMLSIPKETMERCIFEQTGLFIMPEGSTVSHLQLTKIQTPEFNHRLGEICREADRIMEERMKMKEKDDMI